MTFENGLKANEKIKSEDITAQLGNINTVRSRMARSGPSGQSPEQYRNDLQAMIAAAAKIIMTATKDTNQD